MDVWLALCPKEKQKVTKRRDERGKERGGEGEGRERDRQTDRDRQREMKDERPTDRAVARLHVCTGDLGAEATGTQQDTATNDRKERAKHMIVLKPTQRDCPCQRKSGGI